MRKDQGLFSTLFHTKHPNNLLQMYLDNLRVEYDCIIANGECLPQTIIEKIDSLFKASPSNWFNAYKIEQYLSHCCGEDMLDVDVKRELVAYRKHFSLDEFGHYQNEYEDIISNGKGAVEKRSLLIRLQSELHAFYMKRSECHEYGLLARVRVSFNFILALVLFIFSLMYTFYYQHIPTSSEMIVLAFTTGYLGASFSILVGLKAQLAEASIEDLKIIHRQSFIVKRSFIGVGAAVTTYFLLQSGFLTNLLAESLLPELPINDQKPLIESYLNISKLIIWSFIAGFSEMFVPKLLGGVEARITSNMK